MQLDALLGIAGLPAIVPHSFEDGLPPSSWSATDAVTAADGALLLTYDR